MATTNHARRFTIAGSSRAPAATLGALCIFLSPLSLSLLADTAVLPNGERVRGSLEQSKSSGLVFVRADNKVKLKPKDIEYVRFSAKAGPGLRAPALHRVTLWNGERLTGEFRGLDEREVRLRTAWKESLTLPRSAVASVEQAPGHALVFVDDFEGSLAAWRLTGTPALSEHDHTSGRQCLCFNRAGQVAEFVLTEPLEKGRLGINFLERAAPSSQCWLEADFGPGNQTLRACLAGSGDGHLIAVTGTPQAGYLPRGQGWRRLVVDFAPRAFIVGLDNDVLQFTRPALPGTSLRKVRLSCESTGKGSEAEFLFDDFSIARDMPALPRPPGDSQQDELWLLDGDQVFGTFASANQRAIVFNSGASRRSVEWAKVRGIFLRGQTHMSGRPHEAHGNRVRVWLHSGVGGEPDQLEGTISQFDGTRFVLRHEVLGEVEIGVGYLHRLQWLPPR